MAEETPSYEDIPEAATFAEWKMLADRLWVEKAKATGHLRYGQFLWNVLPLRFLDRVPRSYDPYNNEDNLERFLVWLEHRW